MLVQCSGAAKVAYQMVQGGFKGLDQRTVTNLTEDTRGRGLLEDQWWWLVDVHTQVQTLSSTRIEIGRSGVEVWRGKSA